MTRFNSVVVYCGANTGTNPVYKDKAKELGETLAQQQITLIFGAGCVGLMGIIADAVLDHGGQAVGVIPEFLIKWEVAHQGLSEILVVQSMHERKQIMCDRADAVIVLPGGFGTLDEFFEMLTWGQLGLHQKPIGILNINGYFDHLLAQLDFMVEEGFLKAHNRKLIVVENTIEQLLRILSEKKIVVENKWIEDARP